MLYLKKPALAPKETGRHARACDWRLRKYFPEKEWDFEVYDQAKYCFGPPHRNHSR